MTFFFSYNQNKPSVSAWLIGTVAPIPNQNAVKVPKIKTADFITIKDSNGMTYLK